MTQFWNAGVLVVGCGNELFGDDGFGAAVAERLGNRDDLPPRTCVINARLSVRDLLFTVALGESRPSLIILVDAVDVGRRPGEIVERDIDDLAAAPACHFSMHLHPTSALLRELRDGCGVTVKVISTQVERIPAEVSPGLSDSVHRAVPVAEKRILEVLREHASADARAAR